MNISNVSSSNTVVTNSKPHSVVGELQKQKMELTKQIEKVKEGTGDSKTKAERIKILNEQIEELNKQIQEAQIEEQKKEVEKNKQKNAEKAEQEKCKNADTTEQEGVVLSASLNNLLVAHKEQSTLKELSKVRTKILGEMHVAGAESKRINGEAIWQNTVISSGGDKLSQVEGKMAKMIGTMQRHIEQSVKTGTIEAEKERANKQDKIEDKEKDGNEVDKQDKGRVQPTGTLVEGNTEFIIQTNDRRHDKMDEEAVISDKATKAIDILA